MKSYHFSEYVKVLIKCCANIIKINLYMDIADFDEKDQDFNWLSDWGTRFSRLYSMYNVKEKETDDE